MLLYSYQDTAIPLLALPLVQAPYPRIHTIGEWVLRGQGLYRVGTVLVGVGILGGVIGCIIQSSNPLYSPVYTLYTLGSSLVVSPLWR